MFAIISFFVLGVTGGFGHCVLMCHPFVLYISTKYIGSRRGYHLLVPHMYYNLGRTFTYSILGAVAGFFGGVVQYAGSFVNVQKSASIIGGIILIIYAFLSFFHVKLFNSNSSVFSRLFKKLEPSNPFVTGVLLGFLPCGLSMGAIIGAASSGSTVFGAFALAAFGLGTSTALMLTALFGNMALAWSAKLKILSSVLLFFMGCYFIYNGLKYTL